MTHSHASAHPLSCAATPSATGRGLFIRNATNSRSPVPPRLHTDSRGGVTVNPGTNMEAAL